jgi:hypothetical protein
MLADKKHLKQWLKTGEKKIRADGPDADVLLRTYSESLLHERLIKNSSIHIGERKVEGFTFNIYQPFYKATPVGLVLDLEIVIDGKVVPRKDTYFILKGGQRVRLYEARTIHDIWWNIVDPITVFVPRRGGLAAGSHELEVTIAELVPAYYGHPKNMLMGSVKTTMKVKK